MNPIFTQYLFSRHLLVSAGPSEEAFETLYSLASLYGIRIVSGRELAEPEMIRTAQECLGHNVPEAFYRGFPQTVRALSPDALLFDQLLHYFRACIGGDHSKAGFSLMEADFQRSAFRENTEIKDFSIISGEDAKQYLAEAVDDLLASTRPLNEVQYRLVQTFIREYQYRIPHCACKDTAAALLLDTRDSGYAAFLQLSDVIRILDRLCWDQYGNEDLKNLNLRNQDRKFLTQIINTIFLEGQCNIADCFEKKKIWNGLLHHIHYQPVNDTAKQFADAIRGRENLSVYAEFERRMMESDIRGAVQTLRRGKGSGALLRKLNYILSRCENEEDVAWVLQNLRSCSPIVLMQLFLAYQSSEDDCGRIFKFTRHKLLRVHRESPEEAEHRRSILPEHIRAMVSPVLLKNLEEIYRGRLGRVYIDPAMRRIALPLQEATGSGGFGVLPGGTRLPIPSGKKIRCFTYWEKVNDIDLSVIGLTSDGRQIEFSWRTMYAHQSEALTFSGDQIHGYDGGSEYYDVNPGLLREIYPEISYLVLCNNVYSGSPFSRCQCTAGYMSRDVDDSGKIFEPKTVETSFRITCHSTFAYLFAIDLERQEIIWLNLGRNSDAQIAGETKLDFLTDYFRASDVLNVHKLFSMLAMEVVDAPEEADVVVSDAEVPTKEGAERIRSCDTARILALMNSR